MAQHALRVFVVPACVARWLVLWHLMLCPVHRYRHGADPNVRTAQQDTALHCATFGKHYQIAELLLKNGAIPTYKNNDGLSSIDLAEAPSVRLLRQFYFGPFLRVSQLYTTPYAPRGVLFLIPVLTGCLPDAYAVW